MKAEIHKLEIKADSYSDISLIGVQVTQKQNGIGTIIHQEKNRIIVRFATGDKTYVINRKYIARPTFEDDEEILDAFTEYDTLCENIRRLRSQLKKEYK